MAFKIVKFTINMCQVNIGVNRCSKYSTIIFINILKDENRHKSFWCIFDFNRFDT